MDTDRAMQQLEDGLNHLMSNGMKTVHPPNHWVVISWLSGNPQGREILDMASHERSPTAEKGCEPGQILKLCRKIEGVWIIQDNFEYFFLE